MQCSDIAVVDQQSAPLAHTKSQLWPVVMLSQLPTDPASCSRCDSVSSTGRRPSDVYGETARARWTNGRRPLARSASALRAARTKAGIVSNHSSSSLNSTNPDVVAAEHNKHRLTPAVDAVTPAVQSSSNGDDVDTTSGECRSLEAKQFYGSSCVTTQLNPAASTEATAEVDRLHLLVSPSKNNAAVGRKSSGQLQAVKRVKKTYIRTTEKFSRCNQSTDGGGALKNSRCGNAACSEKTPPPTKDEESSNSKPEVCESDGVLPVVPIDEKHASMSITAMAGYSAHLQPVPDITKGSLTIKSEPPESVTSSSAGVSTSASSVTSTMYWRTRNRAEQTIFERFSNSLTIYSCASSAVHTKAKNDAVLYAKHITETVPTGASKTNVEALGTIMPHSPVNENEITEGKFTKTPLAETATDGSLVPCSAVDAGTTHGQVKSADNERQNVDGAGDTEHNSAGIRINSDRKTRGVKASTHCSEGFESPVTISRPVRKRRPTMHFDIGGHMFFKSERKLVTSSAAVKSHGSPQRLPPGSDLSLPAYPAVASESWRAQGARRLSPKRGRGRPTKVNRQCRRRKATDDEVTWVFHKKLLLDGSTTENRKSRKSGFRGGGKERLKSRAKSSKGSKLRAKPESRFQKGSVDVSEQKSGASLTEVTEAAPLPDVSSAMTDVGLPGNAEMLVEEASTTTLALPSSQGVVSSSLSVSVRERVLNFGISKT